MTDHPSHQETNDPLARRVLERIESEHVRPRPRWEFIFKNYTFWTLGALAVILGAFAFSAAFFEVANADWSLYAATHPDFLSFFLQAAPFLWVFVLALFIGLGYANIRHTKRGYRYPLSIIALGAILTSMVLGSALYALGAGEVIEQSLGDHPPFYRPVLTEERAWWQAPQQGVLGGQVLSVATGTSFTLKDFAGNVWQIDSDDLRASDITPLVVGDTVRVVGAPTTATSTSFHACFVFFWQLPGRPGMPPPAIASSSERSTPLERSDECKGIRPYGALRALHGD